MKAVTAAGFEEPRPIQRKALPPALDGRDVLGLAQTGTGKTTAFALPILQRLLLEERPRVRRERPGRNGAERRRSRHRRPERHHREPAASPRALIITPTRELALQVHGELERLGRFTPIRAMALFGGSPIERQARTLQKDPEVIVACPGRLLDLVQRGDLSLARVEILTLDEADHMFDMGFFPDIRRILEYLPERRQNLFFSATMPREIRKLAQRILFKPITIEIEHSKPAETIDHMLYPVREDRKMEALETLFDGNEFRSAIVFMRTKRRARQLAQRLDKRGHSAVALQGNMSQNQREGALRGFRDGRFDVLVATDIAARGLDIEGVSHVVNFDVPNTPDAYTHRIGRTGRAGLAGTAFTFVTPADRAALQAIEKRLGQRIPTAANGKNSGGKNSGEKSNGHKNNGSPASSTHRGSQRTNRSLGNEKPRPSRSRRAGKHAESKTPMGTRLYLGNLSFDTTDDTLHAVLSENGVVKDLHMVSDRETGRPRGFAFAEMSTEAEAQAVIDALDGKELDGRQLTVNEARERQPRPGGGGGGGRRY